jgi:uncharacterized membrane protein YeaQ/YmgE (transglycosylase-associated protein family)
MGLLEFLFWVVVGGLVIGAAGRLAIPGPNPMSIPMTVLVGIGGAFLGGIVARLINASSLGLLFTLEVLGAALIVYLMQRRRAGPNLR